MNSEIALLKTDGVIMHCSVSLDGFAADINDRLDFMTGDWGMNALANEIMANVGCILSGRRGYDISRDWAREPEAYGGAVKVPEFVVTRRPPPDDPDTMFADGNNLAATIAAARSAAAGKMVVVIGPTLGSALMRAGLVDQLVLHVMPVLLGAGRPLYAPADGPPLQLEAQSVTTVGEVTNFIFRPIPG